MKTYQLHSVLKFGQYKGESINEVIKTDPEYIVWCLKNLKHFMISPEVIEKIRRIVLLEFTQAQLNEYYNKKQIILDLPKRPYWRDSLYFGDRPTYNDYNGTYVQDIEGWSDQLIHDILGGEPDAYWNID
jgi:hypothetical protein